MKTVQGTCTSFVRSTHRALHRGLLQPRCESNPYPPPTYPLRTLNPKPRIALVVSLGVSRVSGTVLSARWREKRSRMFTPACEAQGRVFRVFCKKKRTAGRVCGCVEMYRRCTYPLKNCVARRPLAFSYGCATHFFLPSVFPPLVPVLPSRPNRFMNTKRWRKHCSSLCALPRTVPDT